MTSATTTEPVSLSEPARLTQKSLEVWLEACQAFRTWERREILLQEPDEKTLADYREGLKWILRTARMLQVLVKDPDFPFRRLVPQVEGSLLLLEESWSTLENPMREDEANQLLAQYFPDEPRPGSPA